jgi:acyl carrier protein
MLTQDQARELVGRSVRRIVPDADIAGTAGDEDLRQAFELDSLDFLGLVEILSAEAGVRIEEDDYPDLATLDAAAAFLSARAG